MPSPRDRRYSFWLTRFERGPGGAAHAPVALEARDVPAAWRRAEREARGASFALYDPDGRRVRVGVAPPPALPVPLPATAVALSADGEAVVTGHEGGVLRMHDARTGALRWERFVGASRIDYVLVAARAPWLVACARSGEVWVLDSATGEPVLHVADDEARALALSPDDATLALAGAVVELWSLPGGQRVVSYALEGATAPTASAPPPAPPASGAPDNDGGDDAHDAAGGPAPADEGMHAVGFGAAGRWVVGARRRAGGELLVWDRVSGRCAAARTDAAVAQLAVSRDAARALVAAHDGGATVRVVDLATLESRTVYATGAEGLLDVRLSTDERHAIVHDEEAGIYVLDVATGATHAWLDEFEACAYTVGRGNGRGGGNGGAGRAARGDAAGGFDDNEDTRVVAVPRWRRGDPGVPLSGDGRRYAALRHRQREGLVALFDLTSCLPYAALAHAQPVAAVWLNRDGSRAVTRDARGRVFVWDVPDAPHRLE